MKLRYVFPRSLGGQLSVLLIAAVLVVQVVTLAFFAESRRSAIDAPAGRRSRAFISFTILATRGSSGMVRSRRRRSEEFGAPASHG